MDYAASTSDIEAPALASLAIDGTSSTMEAPLTGHPHRDEAPRPRTLARVAVSIATLFALCMTIFCILAPLAWIPFAFVVWAEHYREPCDQPLPAWLEAYLFYSLLMPYAKATVTRVFCGWNALEANDETPPARVRVFNHLVEVLPVVWMLVARLLISRSHTCKDTCSPLFRFVDWYSWFMLVFFCSRFLIGAVGVLLLHIYISRNGELPDWMQNLLQKANAASPDTINKIETVAFTTELFADPANPADERPAGDCCICLQAYNEELEIKRTSCGHFVHTECLEEWLKRARTCPTCRRDLEDASENVAEGAETDTLVVFQALVD